MLSGDLMQDQPLGGPPRDFGEPFRFDTPFAYDPNDGNLLIDLTFNGGIDHALALDAQSTPGAVSTVARFGDVSALTAYSTGEGILVKQFIFVSEPVLTADFDKDGDVDGDDFLAWQTAFGCSSGCSVDADGDDDTDGDDFLSWQAEFGSGVDVSSNAASVPEPQGVILALVVCCGLVGTLRAPRPDRSTSAW